MDRAASASQMGRFETEWLAGRKTSPLSPICRANGSTRCTSGASRGSSCSIWIRARARPTAQQEGSAYNGHFGCTCYHPLFVFNQLGDLERCVLRSGNVHSADGWHAVLEPVIARYRGTVKRLYFRGDAAFANPEIYEFLEAEGIGYAIRLPANSVAGQDRLLAQAPGRTPTARGAPLLRRLQLPGEELEEAAPCRGQGRVASGRALPARRLHCHQPVAPVERIVAFYNQRGTCEQWIKEGKGAIKWTRLSCRTFAANAVRLQLHALAYNLGNFMRTLAMPKAAEPMVADQPAREADQDRRQGHQPRPLRHLPDGRGRGAAADVRGHPVADRPTAGTACASVTGAKRSNTAGDDGIGAP